ncbi:SDR family oxidoreductase [Mangrovibacterium sp.]|uniref:SDR family oxidoreductase n=1 Tax=Mangrovibacterium sp. TaxID=1961364 RepID=UPI0035654B14
MKKHIVVTGGAQGIGKVVSLYLVTKGFRVTVLENDADAIAEMKVEHQHPDLSLLQTDIAVEKEVKQAMELAVSKTGRIDGLINNAAVAINKPIGELPFEEWNRVIAVNLSGPFLCVKYAEEALKKSRGSIINICSTRALQSEPNTEAYSASKGGLLSLTHALAVSLGPEVKVNAISPGWIDVPSVKKKSEARQVDLKSEDHHQHPAGRVGKGEDVAQFVYFLLQAENDFITAQNFVIDGGMTKKMIYVD